MTGGHPHQPWSAEWESQGGDASSPLFPSCTKFPLPSRSWLYVGSIITQLTTTSLHSDKNTNWWPLQAKKEDFQTRAFRFFFWLLRLIGLIPHRPRSHKTTTKIAHGQWNYWSVIGADKPCFFFLNEYVSMKGCRTLFMRTMQVSLKTPWINMRALFKEQEDPFSSDDWYFTFYTIAAHVCLFLTSTTPWLFQIIRNAEITAFMSRFHIENDHWQMINRKRW